MPLEALRIFYRNVINSALGQAQGEIIFFLYLFFCPQALTWSHSSIFLPQILQVPPLGLSNVHFGIRFLLGHNLEVLCHFYATFTISDLKTNLNGNCIPNLANKFSKTIPRG